MTPLADRIDALLPQTQCTKCGFDGCRPYAQAIAERSAPINRCPPGGIAGIAALSALTGRPALPLDPACGVERPRTVAWIDETLCIGCTKCIVACPVDAIIGAARRMHTVDRELCTGCDLCVPACPVDCIEMRPLDAPPWSRPDADAARARHEHRRQRLARESAEADRRLAGIAVAGAGPAPDPAPASPGPAEHGAPAPFFAPSAPRCAPPVAATATPPGDAERKRAILEAAIRSARDRLAARSTSPR